MRLFWHGVGLRCVFHGRSVVFLDSVEIFLAPESQFVQKGRRLLPASKFDYNA
jgi:hypothetical protein